MRNIQLGEVVITAAVAEKYSALSGFLLRCLDRHRSGDWGTLCPEDAEMNDEEVEGGGQLLSSYEDEDGTEVWVITDPKDDRGMRNVTTVLFPSDY